MKRLLLILLLVATFSSAVCAATLIAASNHNFTASSWGTVDATSLLVSNTNNATLTTSYVSSSTFTPGAIEVDGIAVWVNTRLGSAGTFSVAIDLSAVTVSGTEVTIDVADVPAAGNCWVFFKFAAPVTLLTATSYSIKAKTSSATQVNLFRNATANNWSRLLRTTTAAAPGATDNLYVMGEKTGSGTGNTITVTMDNTASTIFGLVDVNSGGFLIYGTSAATSYLLKMAGNLNIRSGGEVNIGTTSARMPADSVGELFFSNSSDVDFGVEVLGSGIFRTGGAHNAVPWALLNADAAASATSLTTDQSTGWKSGDLIGIASTTRTRTESETKNLTADASGTTLTIAALTNAHGGNASTLVQAELINLTRNVKIHGTSTTLQSYIWATAASTCDFNDTEFYFLGSNTTNKFGITIQTTTGSFNAQYCAFRSFRSNQGRIEGNSSAVLTIEHSVMYDSAGSSRFTAAATVTINDTVWILGGNGNNQECVVVNLAATVTNSRFIGGDAEGLILNSGSPTGTFNNLNAHSNDTEGIHFESGFTAGTDGTFSNITAWRNGQTGIELNSGVTNLTFETFTLFGNANEGIDIFVPVRNVTFKNGTIRAGATLTQPTGVNIAATEIKELYFVNCDFGGGGETHSTGDVRVQNANTYLGRWLMDNCVLNSATQVVNPSNLLISYYPVSMIRANFLGQTQNHKTWLGNGMWSYDTAIADTSPSLRITPTSASVKLQSPGFYASALNGQSVAVSVKVRKSVIGDGAAYNGNQPRLIVRRNYGAGITVDTVIDTSTASGDGAFETLSGTTVAVTADCALEFFVDCDGTAGWINVDTFTASAS